MDVQLSAHAEQQIAARKLLRDDVMRLAGKPEQIIRQAGELPVAQSRITFEGKAGLLRVAFRDEGEIRLVVTAYQTSKIDKYWQVEDED